MKVKVVDDRLIVYETKISCGEYDQIILNVNALDLAKALKPYLDSIKNCEVKK